MVWALRNVFMMIQDSAWEPGGRIDPPAPLPFDAFQPNALSVTSPFRIVRSPSQPARPRRRKAQVA
jgi:hypothetical protein